MEKSQGSFFFDAEESNRTTLTNPFEDSNRVTLVNDGEHSNQGSLMKESSGSKSARLSEMSYNEKDKKGKEHPFEEKPIDEKPPPDYPINAAKEETVSYIERAESNETEEPVKPLGRRRRIFNHAKRRWYLYVVGLVVFSAILLPIL